MIEVGGLAFAPLPLRADYLVRASGGAYRKLRVPAYCIRAPWAAVPFVQTLARASGAFGYRRHPTRCNVVHMPSGFPLVSNPCTSDLAILFVINCAGWDFPPPSHAFGTCRPLLEAIRELSGKDTRCRSCCCALKVEAST